MNRLVQIKVLVCCLLAVFVAACSTRFPAPGATDSLPAFDPAYFESGQIYDVIPEYSHIHLYVYRAGALAKLGHNHVISTRDVQGKIYRHPMPEKSGMLMRLPVTSFEIDNPALRSAAGEQFNSVPSTQDINGTRDNMLGEKVLNAAEYPYIDIASVLVNKTASHYLALLRFTVAGNTRDIQVPFAIEQTGNQITISGSTRIKQSDLGLTPFSILMGAISVQDEMDVEFHLVAEISP